MRTETSSWPDQSPRVRVQAPNHLLAIEAAQKEWNAFQARATQSATIYLLDVVPKDFWDALPIEWRGPTQLNPDGGLSPNVWVGHTVFSTDGRSVGEHLAMLLDIRTRVRWVELRGDFSAAYGHATLSALKPYLAAWRCTNCGQRGAEVRPVRCPHAKTLCGDALLAPQLHWLSSEPNTIVPGWITQDARRAGVVVTPQIPSVRELEVRS